MKKENLHITFCMALAMMAAQPLHGFAMDANKAEAISGGANEVANGIATRSEAGESETEAVTRFNAKINGCSYEFLVDPENSDNVIFKGPNGWNYETDIVLPKTVEYNGKTYTITSTYSSAFSGLSKLQSVTLPSTLESIESCAFDKCSNLQSIHIPASVKSMGASIFRDCSSLSSVTFDEDSQLEKISDTTFKNCVSLTSITFPKSVGYIASDAFSKCN